MRKFIAVAIAFFILIPAVSAESFRWRDGFPGKIYVHEHYRAGGNLDAYFRTARLLGIRKTVFLPTGISPDNRGYEKHQTELLKLQKKYPHRIIAFCTIDEADPNAETVFEKCAEQGGKGLKLLGGHPDFYDEPLNSENMYQVYDVAQKYRLPVVLHASIRTLPELESQVREVFSRYPDTAFIFAHYCSTVMGGVHLDQCGKILDDFPNVYVDLTMGGGIPRYHKYIEEDPQPFIDFILKYQDRLLVSSDIILSKSDTLKDLHGRMICDLGLQQHETYRCPSTDPEKVYRGLALPKKVLSKLYQTNPKKALRF